MTETNKIDSFLVKNVDINDSLVGRLRGRYAVGPTMPKTGEPEFGWRNFQTPPIQHEAADKIEMLTERIEKLNKMIKKWTGLELS